MRTAVRKKKPTERTGSPSLARAKEDRGTQLALSRKNAKRESLPEASPDKSFPIIGVGSSAGGMEAFTELLSGLPSTLDIAIIYIQHLAPMYESILTEILSRSTHLNVMQARGGLRVQRQHLYVIPPRADLTISSRTLQLHPRVKNKGLHLPVDFFFRSLAQDQKSNAVGIILSGNGTDGCLGMAAIKEEGGITLAQDQKTAKFAGMPASAIATGCVDRIMAPKAMANELARICRQWGELRLPGTKGQPGLVHREEELRKIFSLLRGLTGVDFSNYKLSTINRRIARRLVLHKLEKLSQYVQKLQQNPSEVEALFQDMLINVTSFFREPQAFQVLKKKVFPRILKHKSSDAAIRVWVPGCSTGEEVYSLAIGLVEFLESARMQSPIQIFGTDISEMAIAKARAGIYPASIGLDVSPERLRRFFVKSENNYQIAKSIRDLCIFSRQIVTQDPPFSHIDLISCRNVLIYMDSQLQKKLMPIFHYALKPSGVFFLGSAETISGFSDLFAPLDKKNRIYTKKPITYGPRVDFISAGFQPEGVQLQKNQALPSEAGSFQELQRLADQVLLRRFTPSGVLVSSNLEVLQFRGHTGPFLEHAPGEASLNLLKMMPPSMVAEVRRAVFEATEQHRVVRKEKLRVQHDRQTYSASIEVIPLKLPDTNELYFLVVFEAAPTQPAAEIGKENQGLGRSRELERLRKELVSTKESLQAIIEEQEATNEELKSANEEIQSSNEELQSTNEELETAKEELQSANEELTTVNEELQTRNLELSELNNDLSNLHSSINIPILMLGSDLTIRRYTPPAEKLFNVIPADIGRRISDIRLKIIVPELENYIAEVIDTLNVLEREVQDTEGNWYSLRIRPYRTRENRIEGVVLCLLDIAQLKKDAEQVREWAACAELMVETLREPVLILDDSFRIKMVNSSFSKLFQISKKDAENQLLFRLGNEEWNIPQLKGLLERVLSSQTPFQDCKLAHHFANVGRRTLLLKARRVNGNMPLIVLAIEDITNRS